MSRIKRAQNTAGIRSTEGVREDYYARLYAGKWRGSGVKPHDWTRKTRHMRKAWKMYQELDRLVEENEREQAEENQNKTTNEKAK